jgi:hypothetical protein
MVKCERFGGKKMEGGRRGGRLNWRTAILSHDGGQPFSAQKVRTMIRETVFRVMT